MIRYKQLITLNVVDQETRQPIGKILDVIYSEDYRKIDYIVIKNDNLIKNKAVIFYEDINFSNNNQALYLKDIKVFQDRLEDDIKANFKFIDKEIRNKDGECIGYIKDIVINKDNGFIDGFIITEGVLEDLFNGRNYMPLLEDTIIKKDCIYVSHANII